jgi:hypothetical protein
MYKSLKVVNVFNIKTKEVYKLIISLLYKSSQWED